jgi:hypothetical protein
MSFSSVFVDAKISNPVTGNVASLSLFGGGAMLPYVQDVSISMARNVNQGIDVTLTPPYDQALSLISKESEWIRLGNTLAVRWGYADVEGMVTDWHYGFMNQPEVSFGEDITITIKATALAWHMKKVARCRDWASDSPMSLDEIAESIAKRYGFTVELGFQSETAENMFYEKRSSFVQGGRTDMQFLMYEAEKCGARMIIQGGKIIFIDASAPLPDKPDVNATFVMYGKIDMYNNVLPMTSFATESFGDLFVSQLHGVTFSPHGPNSNPEEDSEIIRATGDKSDMNSFTSGNTLALPPEKDGLPPKGVGDIKTKASIKAVVDEDEGGQIISLPLSGEDTKEHLSGLVQGVNEELAEEHGIIVSFSSLAIPNLMPGMFVRLLGIGDYFSGTYLIGEEDVKISSSGAEMECKAFGRGFPSADSSLDAIAGKASKASEPIDDPWIDQFSTENVNAEEQ